MGHYYFHIFASTHAAPDIDSRRAASFGSPNCDLASSTALIAFPGAPPRCKYTTNRENVMFL